MIRNKDEILHEKTDKLFEHIRTYLEYMDSLSDTSAFTIDNIEKMWGDLEYAAKQIIREINEDMIMQVDEKAIIKAKKKSMLKKG